MRLIDADALKKAIPKAEVDGFQNCRYCTLLDDMQVKNLIDNAPTVEAERTGHWVNVLYGLGADDAECSNCHNRTRMIPSRNADGVSVDFSFHKFCPHCGTRMVSK